MLLVKKSEGTPLVAEARPRASEKRIPTPQRLSEDLSYKLEIHIILREALLEAPEVVFFLFFCSGFLWIGLDHPIQCCPTLSTEARHVSCRFRMLAYPIESGN